MRILQLYHFDKKCSVWFLLIRFLIKLNLNNTQQLFFSLLVMLHDNANGSGWVNRLDSFVFFYTLFALVGCAPADVHILCVLTRTYCRGPSPGNSANLKRSYHKASRVPFDHPNDGGNVCNNCDSHSCFKKETYTLQVAHRLTSPNLMNRYQNLKKTSTHDILSHRI